MNAQVSPGWSRFQDVFSGNVGLSLNTDKSKSPVSHPSTPRGVVVLPDFLEGLGKSLFSAVCLGHGRKGALWLLNSDQVFVSGGAWGRGSLWIHRILGIYF